MSAKYPRTPHLPFSPGGTSDDRRIHSVAPFLGIPVVITEKMDGSNVCLERNACFARSHASAPNHPSFDAFKAYHASVKNLLGGNTQVFGEWLYARHSIDYSRLPNYFMVFGVRDTKTGLWASWEEVVMWADSLGTVTVPVLEATEFRTEKDLVETVQAHALHPSPHGQREGIVLRKSAEFSDAEFGTSVVKWVRSNHVQTEDHWKSQAIVRNALA